MKTLKSGAVELRLLQLEDAEKVFQLTDKNRDYLRVWLPWVDATKSVKDSEKFIQSSLSQYKKGEGVQFGIYYQGNLVGLIGFHFINKLNRNASIGYWLDKNSQGKGIMTIACKLIMSYAFDDLKLHRLDISCAVENKKSRAIPERLGFKQEGMIRESEWVNDHFVDHYYFGLLASEWEKLIK